MSLEVDARHDGAAIPSRREEEDFKYLHGPRTHWVSGQGSYGVQVSAKQFDSKASRSSRRSRGKKLVVSFRVIVFWIVVICLLALLAIVAAGVAGSMAARRGRNLNSCMTQMQILDTATKANNSSSASNNSSTTIKSNSSDSVNANTPSTTNKSSTADATSSQDSTNAKIPSTTDASSSQGSQDASNQNNTSTTTDSNPQQSSQDSDPGSFIASSDCSSLSSPYIPSLTSMALTSSNISFDIKCGTNYVDQNADFLTVAVFTFEDCIAACASFNERLPNLHPNLTCYIASYGLNLREVAGGASPSCRLKASKNIKPSAEPGVSYSALLITG